MWEENLKTNEILNQNRLHAIEKLQSFLPEEKELIDLNNEIVSIGGEPDRSVLRNWQLEFFQNLEQNLEQGKTEGYVEVPTGAGKTRAFLRLIKATDLKTLIVVPTQLLVDQTHEEHEKQIKHKTVGKRYSGKKDTEQDVLITTYESLSRDVSSGKLDPKEFDLLILDEAHRALTDRRTNAVHQFSNAIKLGFTATPVFNKDKYLGKLLENNIYEKTIQDAIEEEIISGFKVYAVKTNIDISTIPLTNTGEYREDELEKAINIKARNLAAVDVYKKQFDGKKAITYCLGVDHAKNVAKEFRDQGFTAEAGYGTMTKLEKESLLKRYRNGDIQILTGDQLFIEGFDEPSIEVGFMLKPTRSIVEAEQRAGRTLRIDPNNENKIATIVEFSDISSDRNSSISFVDIAGESLIIPTKKNTKSERRKVRVESTEQIVLDIPGFSLTTNAVQVMEMLKSKMDVFTDAPDGWLTSHTIARFIQVDGHTIDRKAREIMKDIPENELDKYTGTFRGRGGRQIAFYSPEIVEKIKEFLNSIEKPPENWLTLSNIYRNTGSSMKVVNEILEEILKDMPEENIKENTSKYYSQNHNITMFYSPEITEKLYQRIIALRELPPEGWMTMTALTKVTEATKETIQKILDKFLENYPKEEAANFSKTFFNRSQTSTYYSPEVIDKIIDELAKVKVRAPEGWLTPKYIAKELGTSYYLVSKALNTVLEKLTDEEKSEISKEYMTGTITATHYSPDIIQKVKQILDVPIVHAPEGWMNATGIKNLAKTYNLGVKKVIDDIFSQMSDEEKSNNSKIFNILNKGGSSTYYSPDIVAKVVDLLKRKH